MRRPRPRPSRSSRTSDGFDKLAVIPPLRVLSSMATRTLLADLADRWHAGGGAPLAIESVGGVDAARRVASGECFNAIVLASDAIDRLLAGGHAVAGTKVDLVQSQVAIAVRRGAVYPLIDSEDALRDAVVAARRVAISTGPSGTALRRLFARWHVDDAPGGRVVEAPAGVPVGRLIVEGSADLGFQQLSELQALPCVEVVGTMPPGLEIVTTFSGVCGTPAETARALLAFWNAPEVDDVKRRHGMTPVAATSER